MTTIQTPTSRYKRNGTKEPRRKLRTIDNAGRMARGTVTNAFSYFLGTKSHLNEEKPMSCHGHFRSLLALTAVPKKADCRRGQCVYALYGLNAKSSLQRVPGHQHLKEQNKASHATANEDHA